VHVQLDLHAMYREVRMLSKELETLNQILEKIRVDEHSDL
jgi:hypothetical protein